MLLNVLWCLDFWWMASMFDSKALSANTGMIARSSCEVSSLLLLSFLLLHRLHLHLHLHLHSYAGHILHLYCTDPALEINYSQNLLVFGGAPHHRLFLRLLLILASYTHLDNAGSWFNRACT